MLLVVATLIGKSSKRSEIDAALTTAAAASREEAGCLSYAFHRDLENADRYVSVEKWQDQAALDAHFQTPHVAELLTLAGELLAAEPEILRYETDGPKG